MATRVATPRSRALGFGLRTARLARKLGVRELARIVGVTPQELSHWEYGTRVPTVAQVGLLLGAMQVEPVERKRLLALAENAREPNWVEPGTAPELAAYVEYERTAATVISWEPLLVPGILQTTGYARAVFGSGSLTAPEIERRMEIRLRRQDLLRGADPLELTSFVGESALRGGFCGAEVLAGQLAFLVSVSGRSNVSLRVVPIAGGFHPGLYGPFSILEFWNLPSIVHLESYRGSAYIYDDREVADYRAAVRRMREVALNEQESRAFIQGVLAELEA
jgi:transcriptional regulator with XRE-family HTH domain